MHPNTGKNLTMMRKKVAVLDADERQCRRLCAALKNGGYHSDALHSFTDLQEYIRSQDTLAVILDIDTVPLNNRTIRALAIENPGVCLLGVSKERFHPELKDAICYHLYACITKSANPEELYDELFYWLKTIAENEVEPKCPAG